MRTLLIISRTYTTSPDREESSVDPLLFGGGPRSFRRSLRVTTRSRSSRLDDVCPPEPMEVRGDSRSTGCRSCSGSLSLRPDDGGFPDGGLRSIRLDGGPSSFGESDDSGCPARFRPSSSGGSGGRSSPSVDSGDGSSFPDDRRSSRGSLIRPSVLPGWLQLFASGTVFRETIYTLDYLCRDSTIPLVSTSSMPSRSWNPSQAKRSITGPFVLSVGYLARLSSAVPSVGPSCFC